MMLLEFLLADPGVSDPPVIWTLSTVTDNDPHPSVTLHGSYESAVAWLRSGWDIEGEFTHLDDEDLIRALAEAATVRASIDPHDRVITTYVAVIR